MAKQRDSNTRARLRQTRDSMAYERGRMQEELSKIGVSKKDVDMIADNAEVRPKATIELVLKSFAEDMDSRMITAVKRCIKNLHKLAKKVRPLRKQLKMPVTASLNGTR